LEQVKGIEPGIRLGRVSAAEYYQGLGVMGRLRALIEQAPSIVGE
jgi:hypothetical protein